MDPDLEGHPRIHGMLRDEPSENRRATSAGAADQHRVGISHSLGCRGVVA